MATVYLAEDLKHDRKVAIKVLKPELAAVLGAERFVQEIKTTAALSHPNILPLFDSGEAGGYLYYVMPYLEGETIREKLNREAQFGIEEALKITTEVAEALEYAHRHGVIHRDIKPENVLLHAGRPMVMDFGIALAVSAAAGGRMTETGLSLGTPHYMSPEQATADKQITARSDVYSLASVLYEMLAGEPPHTGGSAQAIIMKIVTDVPRPVTELRKSVPPNVEAALSKALEKVPADRFATAQAFAQALHDPASAAMLAARGAVAGGGWKANVRNPVVWVLALLAAGASALAMHERSAAWAAGPDAVVRFKVTMPAGSQLALDDPQGPDLAISADGSTVAFPAGDRQGRRQIYVRRLDEPVARALPGTDGGFLPAFSPDGTRLAFWVAGRVATISLDGGAPHAAGEFGSLNALRWVSDGELIFAAGSTLGPRRIMRVAVAGCEPRPVAPLDTAHGEMGQFFPVALPDGKHVLYESWGHGAAEDARIGMLDLETGRARRLDLPGTTPLGVLDGTLIYADQTGTILAVPFDVRSGSVGGRPVPVGGGVATSARGLAVASLSPTGTLAYKGGSAEATLVLANASGEAALLPTPDARAFAFPRYSPDGSKVALAVGSGTSTDVWVADVASGNLLRLSNGGSVNDRPEWSPDGKQVLFRTVRGGRSAIWWQPADQSAPATPLVANDSADYFEAVVTPDGRQLVFQVDNGQADVMRRPIGGGGATPIANTPALESQARVSPDGRWVALVSDADGAPRVVVQPLTGPGAKVPISLRGGNEPVWSRDGRRIFYRAEGKFRVAEVSASPTFRVVSRHDFMVDGYLTSPAPHANYDVAPDGKSLLVLKGEAADLLVVHGWISEVRAKLAEGGGR